MSVSQDAANPKEWYKPVNMTVLPAESDLGETAPEAMTKFFSSAFSS